MAWYVVAAASVAPGSSGVSKAYVVQYKDAADFQKHNGFAPGSAQDPIIGQTALGWPTRAIAQTAADMYNKQPASDRQTGTLPNPNADTVLPPNLGSNLKNPLSGIDAIGDFFSRLTNPHTWLRVAEVVVGAAFLMIGLNALLHNPAGKIAKHMPKVVPI